MSSQAVTMTDPLDTADQMAAMAQASIGKRLTYQDLIA